MVGELIRMTEDDPTKKVCKGSIYDKQRRLQPLPQMKRWHRYKTSVQNLRLDRTHFTPLII